MLKIKVGKKSYTLLFGYRAVSKSRVTKKVMDVQRLMKDDDDNMGEVVTEMFDVLADLVLAGLQKTEEKFKVNYNDKEDVEDKLDMVYDLLDDYLEQDDAMTGTDLFAELSNELFECGFFGKRTPKEEAVMEAVDTTIVPMSHKMSEN